MRGWRKGEKGEGERRGRDEGRRREEGRGKREEGEEGGRWERDGGKEEGLTIFSRPIAPMHRIPTLRGDER